MTTLPEAGGHPMREFALLTDIETAGNLQLVLKNGNVVADHRP